MGKAALQKAGWHNASRQFSFELLSCAEEVNKTAEKEYIKIAQEVLNEIEKDKLYPKYTGNLHDSIATAIFRGSRVIRALYMPRIAVKTQRMGQRTIVTPIPQHSGSRKRIVGADEAYKAVMRFKPPKTGLTAALFVGVPYAEGANRKDRVHRRLLRYGLLEYDTMSYNKNYGYLEDIESVFNRKMKDAVSKVNSELKKKSVKPRKTTSVYDDYIKSIIKGL